jgi:BON domain-containing protein
MKTTLRSLGALTVTVLLTGCGTMSVNPLVQYLDDTGTTTAIKRQLATEAGLRSVTGIGVHTRDDMVTLTGTVATDAERLQIENIARRVAGDNRVISDLRVENIVAASPAAEKPVEPPPQKLGPPSPPTQKPAAERPPAQKPTGVKPTAQTQKQ